MQNLEATSEEEIFLGSLICSCLQTWLWRYLGVLQHNLHPKCGQVAKLALAKLPI